jgi:hypothetical protein
MIKNMGESFAHLRTNPDDFVSFQMCQYKHANTPAAPGDAGRVFYLNGFPKVSRCFPSPPRKAKMMVSTLGTHE